MLVKCKCGHETNIRKENYKKGWEPELCHECYRKQQEEERKRDNLKRKEEQLKKGYPELKGTEKQELFAYYIRRTWIEFYEEEVLPEIEEAKDDAFYMKCVADLKNILFNETDSKFYLDKQHEIVMRSDVGKFISERNM